MRMPDINFQEGLVIVDYGDILITEEAAAYTTKKRRELTMGKKTKVVIIGQAAVGLKSSLKNIANSKTVADITEAMALVPTTHSGRIIAQTFLSIVNTPYPMKAFKDVEEAKSWLKSL
ncbi:MAG: hypothetical protein R3261_10150 [Alphaproteobacteria bacterium]|nr:hypothetical protein [Alphaproteobacteria bacterium]